MDDLEAKLIAARSLRQRGFTGPIVAHALHETHQDQIREAGADYTYLTMNQAGRTDSRSNSQDLNRRWRLSAAT